MTRGPRCRGSSLCFAISSALFPTIFLILRFLFEMELLPHLLGDNSDKFAGMQKLVFIHEVLGEYVSCHNVRFAVLD